MRTPRWAPLFAALAIPLAAAGQNAPAFYGLGDLPDQAFIVFCECNN